MRFIELTDTQLRGNNPCNRVGDYCGDMYIKMQEVVAIGEELKVDAYVHAGDLWDLPILSLNVVDRFVDLMEKTKKPWLVVRGNHDEIGHNPELSGASVLDHLFRRSLYIKHLDVFEIDNVVFEGFDYYHNIEKDIKEKGLMRKSANTNLRGIAVVHAFIVPMKMHPAILHATFDEIKTDFDLVLCGHYHGDFGIHKVGKTTYVGLGALARMALSRADVLRTPQILFVDTQTPKLQIIPLKTAKPYQELFDLNVIDSKEEMVNRIDDFVHSLGDIKVQGLNLRSIVETIGSERKARRDIIDTVVNRIGRFEQEAERGK